MPKTWKHQTPWKIRSQQPRTQWIWPPAQPRGAGCQQRKTTDLGSAPWASNVRSSETLGMHLRNLGTLYQGHIPELNCTSKYSLTMSFHQFTNSPANRTGALSLFNVNQDMSTWQHQHLHHHPPAQLQLLQLILHYYSYYYSYCCTYYYYHYTLRSR